MRAFPGQLLFVAEYQDVVALWSTSDLKMFWSKQRYHRSTAFGPAGHSHQRPDGT